MSSVYTMVKPVMVRQPMVFGILSAYDKVVAKKRLTFQADMMASFLFALSDLNQ